VKMKKTLLAVVILLAVPAIGQEVEHAPTVAQCQADQRLWLSKLESSDLLKDVTHRTLNDWAEEMAKCKVVDPENHWKYYNTGAEALAEQSSRETGFIIRHGLWQQFVDEDAAGKR
jgi:hypothetical protein